MSRYLINAACEGPHDVAFVNRILKSSGFETNEKIKLGDYAPPLGKLLSRGATKTDVAQLNISEVRQVLLPNHVLKRGDLEVFLYSLGGDSKRGSRLSLLRQLSVLTDVAPGEFQVVPDGTKLGMAFLFDADHHGIKKRLKEVEAEIREAFPESATELQLDQNGMVIDCAGIRIGCYVFCEKGSQNGKLEDLLLPLMREDNEKIFDAAEEFLAKYGDKERHKFLRVRTREGGIIEERGNDCDYDLKKSVIGVAAQLQISGKPNAACINRTDYLKRDKIMNNAQCSEILTFFTKLSQEA